MEPFRAECTVSEEDHVFFMVDRAAIAIEPHLMDGEGYVCIRSAHARRLAVWLNEAADLLDARGAPQGE